MSLIARVIVTCCLLGSVTVFASDNQDATLLRKQLDAMNTLQGKFSQTLVDKNGATLEESTGSFALQRPGKFYWKTESPYPQLLISNNETIWLYDPDLETVNVRPFSQDLQQTPALLLSADIDTLRKNFSVNREIKAGSETYRLMPKVTDGLFQELTLVFSDNNLSEFHIQDTLGQTSRFTLQQVEKNQAIAPALFNFTPPPGVEILRDQ